MTKKNTDDQFTKAAEELGTHPARWICHKEESEILEFDTLVMIRYVPRKGDVIFLEDGRLCVV